VWTIQNQWKVSDQYWGMRNNAHIAAAFYIVEKNDGSTQAYVHGVHSLNFMELNAVAGNFYTKPKPSTSSALGALVMSAPPMYERTKEAAEFEEAYLIPSLYMSRALQQSQMQASRAIPRTISMATAESVASVGGPVGSIENSFPGAMVASTRPQTLTRFQADVVQRAMFPQDSWSVSPMSQASELYKDQLAQAVFRDQQGLALAPKVALAVSGAGCGTSSGLSRPRMASGQPSGYGQ
jgi:hypothetical protein